jgi:hypothetical protein
MPRGDRTANRDLAAIRLAGGATQLEASKAATVSERTVGHWLTDPTFANRVVELRDAMVAKAAGRLAESMDGAALVLRTLLASRDENVKLRVAVKLIELGLKVADLHELQQRIESLEERDRERKT